MYNTDINIIGGIPDYHLIYMALPMLIDEKEELHKVLVTNNEFNFRTEKSRKRFLAVINSAFISDNMELNILCANLIKQFENDRKAQALILFWLFSINNTLFYVLNRDVFLKYYYQGRAELPKDDVIAYLKELISTNETLKGKWSEKTIEFTASKYLTVLKKLYMLEGVQKKSFTFIGISDQLLAAFIHIYGLLQNKQTNILDDEFLPFSLISKEDVIARLKKIGKKDWIKMNYTGTSLRVEGSFNTNEIVNGLFG